MKHWKFAAVLAALSIVGLTNLPPKQADEPPAAQPPIGAPAPLPAYLSNRNISDIKALLELQQFNGHYQKWENVEWIYDEKTGEHVVCGLVNRLPFLYRRNGKTSVFLSADSMFWKYSERDWIICLAGH